MTESKLIELRMLNLLRDFQYAREFGSRVKPKFLSPPGAMIWRTLKKMLDKRYGDVLRARADLIIHGESSKKGVSPSLVKLQDIALLLKQEYPRHDLTEPKKLLKAMKDYDRDFESPGLVKDIFLDNLHRAILHEVSTLAANQLDTGKIDIESVRSAIAPLDELDSTIDLEPAPFESIFNMIDAERIPTPWRGVNHELQGGLGRKEMTIVAGAPKMGKTSLMVNLAAYEMKHEGRPVLHIGLADLNRGEVLIRYASVLTAKTREELQKYPKWLQAVREWQDENENWLIAVDLTHRMSSISEIEDIIRRTKEKRPNLRLVVVDRLERMATPGKDGGVRHSLHKIYADLRSVASATNMSIVTDSQASDQAYRRKKVTFDLARESKVDKAGELDIWMGIGRDPDDAYSRFITLQGRRNIETEMHRHHFDKGRTFIFTEEAYEGGDDDD